MQGDRDKITRLLKTARGQLDGLLRMVEEDRYCIDISDQLMATQAILRSANREILHAHLNCCVKETMPAPEAQQKLEEIIRVVDKLSK